MAGLTCENQGFISMLDGQSLPRGATSVSIEYNDVSDEAAGESMTGVMWKGFICEKRTLKVTFNALYPQEVKDLLSRVKGKNSFNVTFYDPESGGYVTSEFYVGNRTCDVRYFFVNHEMIGLTMNLIEVRGYTG